MLNELKNKSHERIFGIRDVLKYIGPGLLVTVGFIDPGNWASNIAAGMAGGSIFAGIFGEPYNIKDIHSKIGVLGILGLATLLIFLIKDSFSGLIYSQMMLSIQLPITVFLQIYLTSSEKVMGKHKNPLPTKLVLIAIGIILTVLNIMLLKSFL